MNILLIINIIIYFVVFLYFVINIKDITRIKFNEQKKHNISKKDAFFAVGMAILFSGLITFIYLYIQRIIYINKQILIYYFNHPYTIPFLSLLVLFILLNFVLLEKYKNKDSEIRKKLIIVILYFLVIFPFTTLSIDHYSYFTNESIIVNHYFGVGERSYEYKDIIMVEIKNGLNDTGKDRFYYHYLIYFEDGEVIDMASLWDPQTSLKELHYILEDKQVHFNKEELSDETKTYILNKYGSNSSRYQFIIELFSD